MDRAVRSLVMVALVSILAAACGNGSDGAGTTNGGTPSSQTGASGATQGDTQSGGRYYPSGGSTGSTGSTGASGSTATGATGAAADVQVSLSNYLFDPDPVRVARGDVVAVRNDNTRTPHTFTVVGEDVDLELAPQETETVEIDLPAGTYKLICRFHETLGMTGTLVVT